MFKLNCNFPVSFMFCSALFSLVCCDLSSSHVPFPIATLSTLFPESLGGSWRSIAGTPVPDLLMSQYVMAHRVSPMDSDLLDGGTFHVNHYVFI